MPTQTQIGKAFEYALITETSNILKSKGFSVSIVKDTTYSNSLASYLVFTPAQQLKYSQAAIAAINHIITLEPRLVNTLNNTDSLTLQLQPDSAGIAGDVRDVLFIRSSQKWEIGISAKNNHKALKHSRLSAIKDFGHSWVGIHCSPNYFKVIKPIFNELVKLKSTGTLWRDVPNKHATFYQPILKAFKDELALINGSNPNIPQNLVSYLIGSNDFYKVIKRANVVEILAFNIHNTLGKSIAGVKAATPLPKLSLPTQIIRFEMLKGSTDTLSMICDNGWQLSFRIHNAESLVVASLKFDVNLVGNPHNMYSNHISY